MTGNSLSKAPVGRENNRILYLDLLRLAAAFFVIVNHTNSRIFQSMSPSATWYLSLAWFFLSKAAVPLFLMISGALSLGKQTDWKRWPWQVLRALTVLLAANLGYYFYGVWKGKKRLGLYFAVKNLFYSSSTALWYLYLWFAMVLFMPFFRKLAQALTRREEQLLILLSVGLGGVIQLLPAFSKALRLNVGYGNLALSVYAGLLFLGHYLQTYTAPKRRTALLGLLVFCLLLAGELAGTRGLYSKNPDSYLALDNRIQLTVTTQAACLFVMARRLCRGLENRPAAGRILAFLGSQAFGIYLLGDLGRQELEGVYLALSKAMHPMGAMLLYELAIFGACMAATILLRCIPGVKRFI